MIVIRVIRVIIVTLVTMSIIIATVLVLNQSDPRAAGGRLPGLVLSSGCIVRLQALYENGLEEQNWVLVQERNLSYHNRIYKGSFKESIRV